MKISPFKAPHHRYRLPVLVAARNTKMARSAHAYVRGNTLQFYEWLDSIAEGTLPSGPANSRVGPGRPSGLKEARKKTVS